MSQNHENNAALPFEFTRIVTRDLYDRILADFAKKYMVEFYPLEFANMMENAARLAEEMVDNGHYEIREGQYVDTTAGPVFVHSDGRVE